MSTTGAKLLRAASEIVGGRSALADRLGIGEAVLSRFMDGSRELPDPLLLRAVDIILAERLPPPDAPAAPSPRASLRDS
jgi:DNA-binding transcriptional regulator YdaS (Cro superfamily)